MLSLFALLLLVAADEWTVLPVPSVCAPAPDVLMPKPLWDGRHVRLTDADAAVTHVAPSARVPIALITQMLEEDARTRGTRLEFFRGSPALLARGDAAAIAHARETLADLDRSLERIAVELEVRVRPNAAGCASTNAAPSRSSAAEGAVYRARVRSGELACFGTRQSRSFLASFDVEVAADSAAADPQPGTVFTGRTVHVRAARVDGGKRVHLSGLVDLADLVEMAIFDPGTPDLGILEQPRVAVAEAVFAGVVESGGTLEIALVGTALTPPDWTVCIRATTQVDPEPSDGDLSGWHALDLAFLASGSPEIPVFRPGAQLERDERGSDTFANPAQISASAVAASVDAARGANAGSRAGRVPMYWTDELLFVPRSDANGRKEALALTRAMEELRTRSGRLEVTHGSSRASLPVCAGFETRVHFGMESAWMLDYRAEIAPQTWIPAPDVQTTFDGWTVEGDVGDGVLATTAWIADSRPPVALERDQAQLGKMQILSRSVRSASTRLVLDAPAVRSLADDEGADASALGLRFTKP